MPDFKVEIRARLAELRLSPVREAEIVEELSQHLEQEYERAISGGASEERGSPASPRATQCVRFVRPRT